MPVDGGSTRTAALVFEKLCMIELVVLLAGIWPDVAVAYEEPDYSVVRSEESFELRRYAPYLVAETDAPGSFSDSRNGAFRRLFDYISGENVAKQKIEMTVPVVTSRVFVAKIASSSAIRPAAFIARSRGFA